MPVKRTWPVKRTGPVRGQGQLEGRTSVRLQDHENGTGPVRGQGNRTSYIEYRAIKSAQGQG